MHIPIVSGRIVTGWIVAGWMQRIALALFLVLAPLPAALAQKKPRANDPSTCPWCMNDPALMKAAGIVSHGGFLFGKNDTQKIDDFMVSSDIRWIETVHFKIGFALGSQKVKLEEKKKLIAELTRLQQALPDVKPENAILDPWLRTHLYAQRCEDVYKRFVQIVRGEEAKFADGSGVWSGSYQGEGPYLGMKQKFEVLMLTNEASLTSWLTEHCGLQLKVTHRWHHIERGALGVVMHAQEGNLRQDPALHGHVAFNLGHNLLDALNHYSYDTPIWFHEGLAHVMERDIDPNNNSFDSGEGAVADMTSKGNWKPEVLKLISSGEAPRMAELMNIKSYAELKLPHHFATWSMIDYLMKSNPEAFAKFTWAIKSIYDARGIPSGANLPEVHRNKFKEIFGMNYAEFDEAWKSWCLLNYKTGVPKGTDPNAPGTTNPLGGAGGLPPAGGKAGG